MLYYLLTGLILGCIVTGIEYATGSTGKRIRTLGEMIVLSIFGTVFFSTALPVSLLPALAMATIFAVINQIPKWYFGTGHGSEIRDLIGVIPPAVFFVIPITGAAWYGAVLGAVEWLIPLTVSDGPLPNLSSDAVANLTIAYSCLTWVTVVIGLVVGDIVDR